MGFKLIFHYRVPLPTSFGNKVRRLSWNEYKLNAVKGLLIHAVLSVYSLEQEVNSHKLFGEIVASRVQGKKLW